MEDLKAWPCTGLQEGPFTAWPHSATVGENKYVKPFGNQLFMQVSYQMNY